MRQLRECEFALRGRQRTPQLRVLPHQFRREPLGAGQRVPLRKGLGRFEQ